MNRNESTIIDIVGADFSKEMTVDNLQEATRDLKRAFPDLWNYWETNWLNKTTTAIRGDRSKLPEGKTLAFMVTEDPKKVVVFVIPKTNTIEEIWEALGEEKQLLWRESHY